MPRSMAHSGDSVGGSQCSLWADCHAHFRVRGALFRAPRLATDGPNEAPETRLKLSECRLRREVEGGGRIDAVVLEIGEARELDTELVVCCHAVHAEPVFPVAIDENAGAIRIREEATRDICDGPRSAVQKRAPIGVRRRIATWRQAEIIEDGRPNV